MPELLVEFIEHVEGRDLFKVEVGVAAEHLVVERLHVETNHKGGFAYLRS